MKNVFRLLMLLVLISSCNKEGPENPYSGKNNAILTLTDGQESLSIDNTWSNDLDFLVRITSPASKDIVMEVNLSGEGREDFKLGAPIRFTIAKGQFEGHFALTPEIRTLVEGERRAEVSLKTSSPEIILPAQPFIITIKNTLPVKLTDHEKALISAYKKKWGVDVLPLLGHLQCDGEIKWAGFVDGGYEYPKIYQKETILIENQIMTVGLSALATEDQIILEFKQNALGQSAFMRKIWEHRTVLDTSFWNYEDPKVRPQYSQVIMDRIGWNADNAASETFDVQLDNVRLDPATKEIFFLGSLKSSVRYPNYPYLEYMGDITVVPFHFETSVWRRMLKECEVDPTFRGVLTQGAVDIYSILNNMGIDRDMLTEEGFEQPNYIAPTAKVDFETHTMVFDYPFYAENSDRYSTVHIVCQPVKQ